MLAWISVLAGAGAAAGGAALARFHLVRRQRYASLAACRPRLVAEHAPLLRAPALGGVDEEFDRNRLARVPGFLAPPTLAALEREAITNRERAVRSYVPAHKKGGTISYEALHELAPACIGLFHSDALRQFVSGVVGEEVWPTADHDQSTSSLLYYTEEGDQIGWHYDHNFYRGRHFTVLAPLRNRNAAGDGPSASQLVARRKPARAQVVETAPGDLIVFEGAEVVHRATPTRRGDERILLSMTFSTDPRIGMLSELIRRLKDTAYYGPRAIWD